LSTWSHVLLEWTLKTFACETLLHDSRFLKGFGWAANPADVSRASRAKVMAKEKASVRTSKFSRSD